MKEGRPCQKGRAKVLEREIEQLSREGRGLKSVTLAALGVSGTQLGTCFRSTLPIMAFWPSLLSDLFKNKELFFFLHFEKKEIHYLHSMYVLVCVRNEYTRHY